MMIKALILLHLWSLAVAFAAWAVQRDKEEGVGRHFPKAGVWLALISLCFVPSILSLLPIKAPLNVPVFESFNSIAKISEVTSMGRLPSFRLELIYLIFCAVLMGRTLWAWFKLQRIEVKATPLADVFTTTAHVPPLTLSWPQRAIIVPEGLECEDALIRHERCHLRHWDAEATLAVLLLRDFMLRGPGISYLVRQWRLAIELRADKAATEMLTAAKRQDYAALLLQGLKPSCDHAGGGALPCPTAHLTSTHYRSVKMRLNQIMQPKADGRKRRGYATLGLTAFSAAIIGFMSQGVAAETNTEEQDVTFVKRIPPKMPTSCVGLDLDTIKITGRELKVRGKSTYQHTAEVGRVTLKFDVTKNGRTENIRIVKSNHPCFEPFAKDAVAQWLAEPSGKKINDTGVMIKFSLTGEDHEDIEGPLNKFLQGGH